MTIETWKFINSFAPWFSAIGTVSAVILSLKLARKDRNVKLKVSAGHRVLIAQGVSERPEYLSIRVVNIGHRDAQIINIGWKAGIFKKRHAIQILDSNTSSSELPVRLKDGEEATYLISLSDNWLSEFSNTMLKPATFFQMYFLKLQVTTSLGDVYESRLEKNLINEISKINKD